MHFYKHKAQFSSNIDSIFQEISFLYSHHDLKASASGMRMDDNNQS